MITIFVLLLILVIYTYLLFPALLGLLAWAAPKLIRPMVTENIPCISIVIIVHNGEYFIEDKLKNCLALKYPANKIEIIVVSDGSTDRTVEIVKKTMQRSPVVLVENEAHMGKNFLISTVLGRCSGEILIMTDVSALIESDAVRRIVRWFSDISVGGVCGRKIFSKRIGNSLVIAQMSYLSYEDFIRNCESRISSIASNEGFFYAVRKELVQPIPLGVTDDLFLAMSVVRRDLRFLYDPKACAVLPIRARTPEDELTRRRRIVCGSLLGICEMRTLLNPCRYPSYSWILFSHKVLRRLMPIVLMLIVAATIPLIFRHSFFLFLSLIEFASVFLFIYLYISKLSLHRIPKKVEPLLSSWFYFFLGNLGTLLGTFDLVRGVKYSKWSPLINKD